MSPRDHYVAGQRPDWAQAQRRQYTAWDMDQQARESRTRGLEAGIAGTVLVQLVIVFALHVAGVI